MTFDEIAKGGGFLKGMIRVEDQKLEGEPLVWTEQGTSVASDSPDQHFQNRAEFLEEKATEVETVST